MKRKKSIVALAVIFTCSLLLFTGCKPNHQAHHGALVLDYITEVLDLNDAQVQQLKDIRDELIAEFVTLRQDKEEMHNTLKTQLSADSIDREVIRQLVADHRQKMDGIIDIAIDRLADFHAGLSQEQRTKLISKLEKFEDFHRSDLMN